MVDRLDPSGSNLLDLAPHALRINLRRGRERAQYNGHVVFLAVGVDDVGEKKRLALIFRNPADKLPAHQRMELSVLVDRTVDTNEQALAFEIGQMLLEIEPRFCARAGG